jgi:hypothetical protein
MGMWSLMDAILEVPIGMLIDTRHQPFGAETCLLPGGGKVQG